MESNTANPAGRTGDGTREASVTSSGAGSGARTDGVISDMPPAGTHHPTADRADDRSYDRTDDEEHDPSDANNPADGSVDGAMASTTDGGHGSGGTSLGGTMDGQGHWQPGHPPEPYRDVDVPVESYPGEEQSGFDDDEEYLDEYTDGALFTEIFSAPSLALAAFVFALTGLLGGMIPQSLPYLVIDPSSGPAYHVRVVGLVALGFAIVAASLGLAAMLRSIGSPLRWPRYLGGAAVLLALLLALQSVLLIALAGISSSQGALN